MTLVITAKVLKAGQDAPPTVFGQEGVEGGVRCPAYGF